MLFASSMTSDTNSKETREEIGTNQAECAVKVKYDPQIVKEMKPSVLRVIESNEVLLAVIYIGHLDENQNLKKITKIKIDFYRHFRTSYII